MTACHPPICSLDTRPELTLSSPNPSRLTISYVDPRSMRGSHRLFVSVSCDYSIPRTRKNCQAMLAQSRLNTRNASDFNNHVLQARGIGVHDLAFVFADR